MYMYMYMYMYIDIIIYVLNYKFPFHWMPWQTWTRPFRFPPNPRPPLALGSGFVNAVRSPQIRWLIDMFPTEGS